MFTIITPVFNKKDYLLDTINSVLNQTFQTFEYIIIDDGSTDGSTALIERIKDVRIKFIKQENCGVSVARNRGILESTQPYIIFLDADDILHPDHLKWLHAMISLYPNYSFYATGYKTFSGILDHRFNNLSVSIKIMNKHCFIREMSNYPFVWTGSICIKKEFIIKNNLKFTPKSNHGEDLTFWFKTIDLTDLVYCDIKTAYYRIDTENSLTKSTLKYLPEHIQKIVNKEILKDVDTSSLCYKFFLNQYLQNISNEKKSVALNSLKNMIKYKITGIFYAPILLLNHKNYERFKNAYKRVRAYLYNSK
jgi:glycosyltransferase involved in cell wall biosynthesis